MNKLPEIHCTVQYLSDRLPFVAQGAIVDTYGSMDMSMDVEGIFLYSKDEPRPKPSCVYLCRPEHLDGLGTAYQGAVMICINNGEPMAHVPPGYGGLMVRCSQSLEFIFNGLQKVLVGLKKSNGLLDRAILEEMSIPDIVSIAEQNFINPFLLFDANFELLGWSRSHPCSDPLFLETVGEKQLPQKYMVRLIRRGTLRKLNASGTVVLAGEEGLDRSTVVMVMLKRDGLVIGYGMLICCQQEARRAMIRGFEEFASKLKARLEKTSELSCLQNSEVSWFYIMLLNGRIKDPEEIDAIAAGMCTPNAGWRVIHVIQCTGNTPSRYAFREFAAEISAAEAAFVYGDAILAVELLNGEGPKLAQHPAYHTFLGKHRAKAGISAPFCQMREFAHAYRQAARTLEIGVLLSRAEEPTYFDHSRSVYRFADYLPYLMIEREYTHTKCFALTCPGLLRLISLDAARKTELARTLFVYLCNDGHVTDTAHQMFFHRNSILNRIKQVSELLKADLSDPRTRARLVFDFQVIDYAKAVGKTEQLMKLAGPEGLQTV